MKKKTKLICHHNGERHQGLFVTTKYLPNTKASFFIVLYIWLYSMVTNVGVYRDKRKGLSSRNENAKMNVII